MNIVIVGTGLAGAQAAQELRTQGYTVDVLLVGDEPTRRTSGPTLQAAPARHRRPRLCVRPPDRVVGREPGRTAHGFTGHGPRPGHQARRGGRAGAVR